MVARGRSHRQNRRMPRRSNNEDLEDIDKVEDLPPVSTASLLNRVQAAIYLSMDELYTERNKAKNLVKNLYEELKISLTVSDNIKEGLVDRSYSNDDDFFQDLEADSAQTNMKEEDE
ncbi:1267_t:CDS:2, partial [Cetraspora pellucida]